MEPGAAHSVTGDQIAVATVLGAVFLLAITLNLALALLVRRMGRHEKLVPAARRGYSQLNCSGFPDAGRDSAGGDQPCREGYSVRWIRQAAPLASSALDTVGRETIASTDKPNPVARVMSSHLTDAIIPAPQSTATEGAILVPPWKTTENDVDDKNTSRDGPLVHADSVKQQSWWPPSDTLAVTDGTAHADPYHGETFSHLPSDTLAVTAETARADLYHGNTFSHQSDICARHGRHEAPTIRDHHGIGLCDTQQESFIRTSYSFDPVPQSQGNIQCQYDGGAEIASRVEENVQILHEDRALGAGGFKRRYRTHRESRVMWNSQWKEARDSDDSLSNTSPDDDCQTYASDSTSTEGEAEPHSMTPAVDTRTTGIFLDSSEPLQTIQEEGSINSTLMGLDLIIPSHNRGVNFTQDTPHNESPIDIANAETTSRLPFLDLSITDDVKSSLVEEQAQAGTGTDTEINPLTTGSSSNFPCRHADLLHTQAALPSHDILGYNDTRQDVSKQFQGATPGYGQFSQFLLPSSRFVLSDEDLRKYHDETSSSPTIDELVRQDFSRRFALGSFVRVRGVKGNSSMVFPILQADDSASACGGDSLSSFTWSEGQSDIHGATQQQQEGQREDTGGDICL
ncbi:hypothetical protein PoB_001450600 [Plakobranchus ocellatus]|uniref:Uncharacterized protein n=1 Tax=Plakobranchus ocellatus TaxID=259542 RepID=A0AAV3Z095_9GAST|nr:hypothetical protein PoB_001450600 [Plakobranchus ocellatus]